MHAINEVTNYPMIRPLVTMDKLDIIKISKEINAYPISIRPYEDCCTIFVPKNPKTKPKKEKVNRYENQFSYEEDILKAIEKMETVTISSKEKVEEQLFNDLL